MQRRLTIPKETADRIEQMRQKTGNGQMPFGQFATALLRHGLEAFEAAEESLTWGEEIRIVPDPTLPENTIKVLDNTTGMLKVLHIQEDEETGHILAVDADGRPVLVCATDPKTNDPLIIPVGA